MGRWELIAISERPAGRLTGKFSDGDRAFRLHTLVSMLLRAEVEAARVHREFDSECAAAKNQNQHELVDQAIRNLFARRAEGVA
jgi:hypothetical protein